jgi:hypothetical protein
MSAAFPIDPAACRTALGRWLAETIKTTRFDDDASRCVIVTPYTEEGLQAKDFLSKLLARSSTVALRSSEDMQRLHRELQEWMEERGRYLAAYGDDLFRYRVMDFAWPVFGSRAAGGAGSPEDYFDACAKAIRETNGVIRWAGLSRATLPESLARTMANNGGLALLKAFESSMVSGSSERQEPSGLIA